MPDIQDKPNIVRLVPSVPVDRVAPNQAISAHVDSKAIEHLVNNSRPLRRPNRNRPFSAEDAADIEANKTARESGDARPIGELWNELGLE